MKFHEFTVDDTYFTDEIHMTTEKIKGFADTYDPQFLHTNEEAAKEGPYGSITASGFHVLTAVWSELIKMDILGEDARGSLGMDKIQWQGPVRPGDTLTGIFKVINKKEITDKTRGIISFETTVLNQRGQEIMKGKIEVFIAI
ncbi:MaoC/PaaZ C-terminal domain-containing protein [Virgibacillus xinjiangensis]|uniref:MaoC/PaaZ C-terminal domain-containing protein n=1 Tax=Virgibacillus xinjiangensis TaxID=393090 RepID=A0ABV7CZ80_9BACI